LVESSDALLEREQRFVYLGSIHPKKLKIKNLPRLLALVSHVGSSFATGQINETQFAMKLVAIYEVYLQNRVRTTRIIVGAVLALA
jgi:hypothetical protein